MEISGKDCFTLFEIDKRNMEYYENVERDVSQTSQDEEKHVFKFFIVNNFLCNTAFTEFRV